MAASPPVNVYRCARCDKKFKTGELRTHSHHTGNSYCIDLDACARRAKRKAA